MKNALMACFLLLALPLAALPALAEEDQAVLPSELREGDVPEKPTGAADPTTPRKSRPPRGETPRPVAPKASAVQAPSGPAPASGREQFKRVIFRDDFNDNRNNWSQTKQKDAQAGVRGGVYEIHRTDKGGHRRFYVSVGFRQSEDFILEATLKSVSNPQNAGFGLIWGYDASDEKNHRFYGFEINPLGKYLYYKYDKKFLKKIDWAYSSAVRTGPGAVNRLAVEKKGEDLLLYVNGVLVDKTRYETPTGLRAGFVVERDQRIEADAFEYAVFTQN